MARAEPDSVICLAAALEPNNAYAKTDKEGVGFQIDLIPTARRLPGSRTMDDAENFLADAATLLGNDLPSDDRIQYGPLVLTVAPKACIT